MSWNPALEPGSQDSMDLDATETLIIPRMRDAPVPDSVTVEREDGTTKGRYRVVIAGVEAEMTYSRVGLRLIIIDHTFVPDAMRGRRVGVRMVQQAVEDARREGTSILPLCPFAKVQIERHPEWQDVLQRPQAGSR